MSNSIYVEIQQSMFYREQLLSTYNDFDPYAQGGMMFKETKGNACPLR